jgi:hypothetical protein
MGKVYQMSRDDLVVLLSELNGDGDGGWGDVN